MRRPMYGVENWSLPLMRHWRTWFTHRYVTKHGFSEFSNATFSTVRSVAVVTNFLKFDIDYGLIIHSLSKCLDVYSKEGKVRVEAEVESQEEGELRVEAKVEVREEGVSREEGESRDEGRVEREVGSAWWLARE